MIVVNPNEPIEYRLQDGDPAVFLIRPMTVAMEKRIAAMAGRATSFHIEVLRLGLAGWDGVTDAEGNAIPFATDKNDHPTDDTLNYLPMNVRAELAIAIVKTGRVDEDDLKNLR